MQGYASVNGLELYHELHGDGGPAPLVLLHGAFSAIGTSFGTMLPGLSAGRQVIGVELQGHGRTADIDRRLTSAAMADDVAGLLDHLGIERADLFGYSMGAGVAMQAVLRHPSRVRRLVLASFAYNLAGLHPGLMDGLGGLQPEWLHGTPWHDEYLRIAPRPDDFPTLVRRVTDLNMHITEVASSDVAGIRSPLLEIVGDSDIVRPEGAVDLFRLVGGGVSGDTPAGLPASQLAILPGTSHTMVPSRADLIVPMVTRFLDAPDREPAPGPQG